MFIELTEFNSGETQLFNLDLVKHIDHSEIYERTDPEGQDHYRYVVFLTWADGNVTRVEESFEEVKLIMAGKNHHLKFQKSRKPRAKKQS